MNSELNISTVDIAVRAQFLQDLYSKFVLILKVYCTGYFSILSDQVDETYIRLRLLIEKILGSAGFENLLNNYPKDTIPNSLHSIGEDADSTWEFGLQQAVNLFKGEIIEFCINVKANYSYDKEFFSDVLKSYDVFIDSYMKDKRAHEIKFMERANTQAILNIGTTIEKNSEIYIDESRINELTKLVSDEFDLSKLIELCKELNSSYKNENYLSCTMLVRAIIDHVPPIFQCKNFSEIVNNYKGSKSFKKSMANLENSLRNIADSYLHTQIRLKDTLPNKTQVNFKNDLDVLLSEIARLLQSNEIKIKN